MSTEDGIELVLKDGSVKKLSGHQLVDPYSRMLFERTGEIREIRVSLKEF